MGICVYMYTCIYVYMYTCTYVYMFQTHWCRTISSTKPADGPKQNMQCVVTAARPKTSGKPPRYSHPH